MFYFIFLQNLFFLDKGNNILHYCETQESPSCETLQF